MPRKSPYVIVLTPAEETELTAIARKYTLPYYRVLRARIVLLAAQDLDNSDIATQLNVARQLVSKWRKRFFEHKAARTGFVPRHLALQAPESGRIRDLCR